MHVRQRLSITSALIAATFALTAPSATAVPGRPPMPPPHPGGNTQPPGTPETFRVNLPSFPLGGLSFGADAFIEHPDIWITEIRAHLEYETSSFPAEDISVQLFPNVHPVPGLPLWPNGDVVWNLVGSDLNWSGTGTFTADVSTTIFNGWAQVAQCLMPALNFWAYQFTNWEAFQNGTFESMGGQFTNSYFEIEYIPMLIDYTCAEDITNEIYTPDADCEINMFDLLMLLQNWGTDGDGADIAEPLDVVDQFDLMDLLAEWGLCDAILPDGTVVPR